MKTFDKYKINYLHRLFIKRNYCIVKKIIKINIFYLYVFLNLKLFQYYSTNDSNKNI